MQGLLGALTGLLCLLNSVSAQTNADYQIAFNLDYFDSLVKSKAPQGGPGFIFKIFHKGELIRSGKYGLANLSTGAHFGFDTPTYIASLGKTFTSAAILLLRQEGKLDLKAKVGAFFPQLPAFMHPITIEQLLYHSSGLPDHFDHFGESVTGLDNSKVLAYLNKVSKLAFEPGTDYAYSNSGYVLLSEIVTRVSGIPFAEFLNRHIFQPLEMTNTKVITHQHDIPEHRAIGYVAGEESDYSDISTTGAGGIYSTLNDLVLWDRALNRNDLLSAESKQLAFTKARIPNKRTYLAMGWMDESFGPKTPAFEGLSYVMAFGSLKGFRAKHMRFIDFGLSFILLSNSGEMPLWGEDIARAFFKKR